MFWGIYNLLFAVGFTALLPKYLLRMRRRGGYRRGFAQRFGSYDPETLAQLAGGTFTWVHAVSVGEVHVALRFMAALREAQPERCFVLTTNTSTGHAIAKARLESRDVLLYFPVDLPVFIRRVLDMIRPEALILTECELWPNLLRMTQARGIPVVLINGRLSESSYRGYRKVRPVARRVLACIDLLLMQCQRDADRMIDLGAAPDRVHVMGTAKYDVARVDEAVNAKVADAMQALNLAARVCLVGASTWPGEEAALVRIYRALKPAHPELLLVLVPRHFERGDAVMAELSGMGVTVARRTQPGAQGETVDVLLADTTGELVGYYDRAAVVFVGKSLTEHGGQNMIEPALYGKPVLFGPHTENFPGVTSDLLEADAAIRATDETALREAIGQLLADPDARAALGTRAQAVVAARRGVIMRSVVLMTRVLRDGLRSGSPRTEG